MAYTFASTGDTFAELQQRVLANSFSSTRYLEEVKAQLNEAVEQICKRLLLFRASTIVAYDSAGLVTQPAAPYFRVEEVWLASSGTTGTTGDQLPVLYGRSKLEPLPWASTGGIHVNTTPLYYTARRAQVSGTRIASLTMTVLPASAAGKAIITGLQRPTLMTADAHVTGLGHDLDRAVIAYSKARLFELEDDDKMAVFWDSRYDTLLREGATDVIADGPRVTPGMWDDSLADGGR